MTFAIGLSCTAFAAQAGELTVGFGPGLAPDYVGSNDLTFAPLPSIEYRVEGRSVKSNNLGFEVDIIADPSIGFGPIVRYDPGRNDLFNVHDAVVRKMHRVSGALEAGGFVELTRQIGSLETSAPSFFNARLSAAKAVDVGHDGALVEGSAGLSHLAGGWLLGANVTAAYGSKAYQSAYFGVDARDALQTGLGRYSAGAGLRDVGAGVIIGRSFGAKWSGILIGAYSRIVGDAAKSPVVRDRGSRNQGFVGFSVSYRVF